MLKSLKIENFRCFPSFEMGQLGRLNLIVGTNNSGKTSILEAIQLLISQSNLEVLQILKNIMVERGEYISDDSGNRELDIRHIFCGHELSTGCKFSITGKQERDLAEISMAIENNPEKSNLLSEWSAQILSISRSGKRDEPDKIPLSINEAIPIDYTRSSIRRLPKDTEVKVQFVSSSSLMPERMIDLFDRVVLTPSEDLVIEALQTIEKNIKRIATNKTNKLIRYRESRVGFFVLLSNNSQRIPIGSMGDGMWRMLGLALAIVNAKDGVLLVDEIDTGLHFTVMSDMWKMLWETAKRLNVQIFATTHSNDCWTSLADIANAENPSEDGITIHRIEKGKPHSIVFTERQIVIAAERHIEVR
ncbi:AAA family ATPase [Pseudanabaena mucicola]|uniref:AAA family ATPase n=1 Tax=Pseudanabaena mucicola FACHB-723 TaxID=2692860 RepID=A0ABR7ZYI3_9CYAN|nr:ATP-binding protein [Pseudanabaena mucicola]MBD2188899.1 AAA family ATPase [Pseudanabaena mucicola FACHB-723]